MSTFAHLPAQRTLPVLKVWTSLNSLYKVVKVLDVLRALGPSPSDARVRAALKNLPFAVEPSLFFFKYKHKGQEQHSINVLVEKGDVTIDALRNGTAIDIRRDEGYLHPFMMTIYHDFETTLQEVRKAEASKGKAVKDDAFPAPFGKLLKGGKTFELEADYDLHTNQQQATQYQIGVIWQDGIPSSGSRPYILRDMYAYINAHPLSTSNSSSSSNPANPTPPRPTHQTRGKLPPSFHVASVDPSLIDASPFSVASSPNLNIYDVFLGSPNPFTYIKKQEIELMDSHTLKVVEQFLSSFFIKHEDGTKRLATSALLGSKMIFFGPEAEKKMWERVVEPTGRGGKSLQEGGESSAKKKGVLGLQNAVVLKPAYQKLGRDGIENFDESICDDFKNSPVVKNVLKGLDDDLLHLWDPSGAFGDDVDGLVAEFDRVSRIFEGQGCGNWHTDINSCRYCYAADEFEPSRKKFGPGKLGAYSTYEEDTYDAVDEEGRKVKRQVMYCPADAKLQQFCKDSGISFVDFLALQGRVKDHPRQIFGTFSVCSSCSFPVLANGSAVAHAKCLFAFVCPVCREHELRSEKEVTEITKRNAIKLKSNLDAPRTDLESALTADEAHPRFVPCGVNSVVCRGFAQIKSNMKVTARLAGLPACTPCFSFDRVRSDPPPRSMLESAVERLINDQLTVDAGGQVEFPTLSDFMSDVALSIEGRWYYPGVVYSAVEEYLKTSPAQAAMRSAGFKDLLARFEE